MAKKKVASSDFNMSLAMREALTANPAATAKEIQEAILAKHPSATINQGSFSVAFYTTRRKLGLGSNPKEGSKSPNVGIRASKAVDKPAIDLAALQQAAQFLRQVGGADAALEAIKQVQTMQVS